MSTRYAPSCTSPDRPGLLLSFDDAGNIPYWHRAMDVLRRFNAQVTFFIDRFDLLKPEDVQMLRDFRAAGHAIGCHSLRHFSATLYAQEHGMERYLITDIEPAIAAMHARGFDTHSFAYPNSRHDDQTDTALSRYFGRLRSGAKNVHLQPLEKCDALFTPLSRMPHQRTMLGTGIDSITERTAAVVRPSLVRAAAQGEVLTLYAHRIEADGPPTSRLGISQSELARVLETAREQGLSFYTFNDLPACPLSEPTE
jgi:hypothetical protein